MDTSLSTIESVFVCSNSAQLVTTELPSLSKSSNQVFSTTFRNISRTNTSEETSYNNIKTQNKDTDKPFQASESTIDQKSNSEKPQKSGPSNQPEEQNPSPNTALHPNIVQQCLAQYAQNTEQDQVNIAEVVGYKPAAILSCLIADESSFTDEQTLESAENETPTFAGSSMIGLKNILLNAAEQLLAPDNQLNKVENAGIIQISNKTLLATEDNNSELLNQKVVIDADGKITATAGKTAIIYAEGASNGQKISTLSIDSLLVQTQGKEAITPETSPSAPEQSAANESAFLQQSPNAQELTESSDSSSKKHNLLNDSTTRELIVTEQRKNQNNLTSDSISKPIFERLVNSNNTQINPASDSLNFAEAEKTSNDTLPRDTVDGISRQISESIQNSLYQQDGKQQITVRLNPPELGRVCIKFNQQQDQLTGILEVDRTQTKHEIEQALPQIIRNLGDAGIQIRHLEVTLTNQNGQQLIKDQSSQNDSFQQHQFAGNNNHYNQSPAGTNEWFVNYNSYEDTPETQGQYTDTSINMLV